MGLFFILLIEFVFYVMWRGYQAENLLLWLMAFVPLILIYFFVGLYKTIVIPLKKLVTTAKAITSGDYSNRVSIDSRDELGVLGKTFNEMTVVIQEKFRILSGLQESLVEVTASLDMEVILHTLVQRAAFLMRSELAALCILHPETGAVQYFTANIPAEIFPVKKKPEGRGLLGVVLKDGVTIRVEDIHQHPRSEGFPPEHPPIRNLLGIPLYFKDAPLKSGGGLFVANKVGNHPFAQEDEELLKILSIESTATIQNARLHLVVSELATKDSLTGLCNRRSFSKQLMEEINRATRYHRPFSVMMLDIDYFKKINDAHGHLAGDSILQQLAKILTQQVREIDTVARYGGEEFIVLLPKTILSNALRVGNRMRSIVEQNCFISPNQEKMRITISIGIASSSAHVTTAETLIEQADHALYQAKHAGRNQVCIQR